MYARATFPQTPPLRELKGKANTNWETLISRPTPAASPRWPCGCRWRVPAATGGRAACLPSSRCHQRWEAAAGWALCPRSGSCSLKIKITTTSTGRRYGVAPRWKGATAFALATPFAAAGVARRPRSASSPRRVGSSANLEHIGAGKHGSPDDGGERWRGSPRGGAGSRRRSASFRPSGHG